MALVKPVFKVQTVKWLPSFPRKAWDRFKQEHTLSSMEEMVQTAKDFGPLRETAKCWDELFLRQVESVREFAYEPEEPTPKVSKKKD